ncbi:TPA: hypothetical protein OPJ72_004727, partial [Escherichia coli]|nr:hypothetical protein [Escherichia coli]
MLSPSQSIQYQKESV